LPIRAWWNAIGNAASPARRSDRLRYNVATRIDGYNYSQGRAISIAIFRSEARVKQDVVQAGTGQSAIILSFLCRVWLAGRSSYVRHRIRACRGGAEIGPPRLLLRPSSGRDHRADVRADAREIVLMPHGHHSLCRFAS